MAQQRRGQGVNPAETEQQQRGLFGMGGENNEDQQQQTAPAYQSHPQNPTGTEQQQRGLFGMGGGNNEDQQQKTATAYPSHPQNPAATYGVGEGMKHSGQGMQPGSGDDHKKGFTDKIADKLPGRNKEDQQQQTAPSYQNPAATYGTGEGKQHAGQGMQPASGDHQKKGFVDKMADKLPGRK